MPFSGHLNPSIKLAKYLKNKGYEVVFGGDENVLKFTKQYDFLFTKIISFPFGINLDSVLHKNSKERWLEGLIDRWTDRLYKTRETELVKIVKELRPTHIFIDAFLSSDFVVLYPLLKQQKIKTCFLQTMLPTHYDHTPPLNTVLMPHDKKATEKAWKAYFRKNALKYWTQNMLFLGKSDINIVKLKIKKQQISKHYTAFRNKTFHIGFENITELILAPQAFDFEERSLLPWQHYLGTMIDLDRPENIAQTYLDTIQNLKISHQKLVFCSLGSINMLEKKGQTARLFFENPITIIIKVFLNSCR